MAGKHVQEISQRATDYQSVVESLRQKALELRNDGEHEFNEPELFRNLQVLVEQKQKEARNIGEDLLEDMLSLDGLSDLLPEERALRKATIGRIEMMLEGVDTAKATLSILRRRLDNKVQNLEDIKHNGETTGSCEGQLRQQLAIASSSTSTQTDQLIRHKEVELDIPIPQPPIPTKALWKDLELSLQFSLHEQAGCYLLRAPAKHMDARDVQVHLHRNRQSLTVEGYRMPSDDEELRMQQDIQTAWHKWANGSVPRANELHDRGAQQAFEAYKAIGRGSFGHFSTEIAIPRDVNIAGIEARCNADELCVVLPRVPRARWRRAAL